MVACWVQGLKVDEEAAGPGHSTDCGGAGMLACGCLCPSDSKIRIFDGGAKRTDVHTFPAVVHLVSQAAIGRQTDRQTDWWRLQAGAGVHCMHSPTA